MYTSPLSVPVIVTQGFSRTINYSSVSSSRTLAKPSPTRLDPCGRATLPFPATGQEPPPMTRVDSAGWPALSQASLPLSLRFLPSRHEGVVPGVRLESWKVSALGNNLWVTAGPRRGGDSPGTSSPKPRTVTAGRGETKPIHFFF